MQAVKHSLHRLWKKSHLGPKHCMTLPPPKKTREVRGDQGDERAGDGTSQSQKDCVEANIGTAWRRC